MLRPVMPAKQAWQMAKLVYTTKFTLKTFPRAYVPIAIAELTVCFIVGYLFATVVRAGGLIGILF